MNNILTVNATKGEVSYDLLTFPTDDSVVVRALRTIDGETYPIFKLHYDKEAKETTLDLQKEMNTTSLGVFSHLYNQALDILDGYEHD